MLNSVSLNAIKISCCRVSQSAKICDENSLQLSRRGHVSSPKLAMQINRVSPERDDTLTDPVSVRKADRQRDCAQDHARSHAGQIHLSFQKRCNLRYLFIFLTELSLYLPANDSVMEIGLRSICNRASAPRARLANTNPNSRCVRSSPSPILLSLTPRLLARQHISVSVPLCACSLPLQ